MKALITGINGFAGSYLAETLIQSGVSVSGIVEPGSSINYIAHIKDKLDIYQSDILDRDCIEKIFKEKNPSHIFHLAGLSSVKDSFARPQDYFRVNLVGGEVILSAAVALKKVRILVVTSGDIYGDSLSAAQPVNESSPIKPLSPYAVSKAAIDMLAKVFFLHYGLEVVIARPFSHIGPRQSAGFFVPTIAQQIAAIIKQRQAPCLHLGEVDIYRDFTDVRDIVRAYVLLAEKGKAGEAYNICSGQRFHLRQIVYDLVKMSGREIMIMTDPERIRKVEITDMHLDNNKLRQEIGWEPQIPLAETLNETLAFWMEQIGKK